MAVCMVCNIFLFFFLNSPSELTFWITLVITRVSQYVSTLLISPLHAISINILNLLRQTTHSVKYTHIEKTYLRHVSVQVYQLQWASCAKFKTNLPTINWYLQVSSCFHRVSLSVYLSKSCSKYAHNTTISKKSCEVEINSNMFRWWSLIPSSWQAHFIC
jgi:hypothetical protein